MGRSCAWLRHEGAGGGRQWLGGGGGGGGGLAGVGGRGGAGGVFLESFMQRQVPADLYWRCPRSSSSTVVGSPVACSTCTHSANCAETVKFSRCRSWTGCLHPVIVQRGAQFGLAGRRHPSRGAHADSYGPSIQTVIEILLLQYIDKVIDVGCRSCSSRSIRGGDSRAPTVAPIAWTVVAMPVVVQRQLLWSRRQKTAQVPQLQYVFVVDVCVVQVHLASILGQGC